MSTPEPTAITSEITCCEAPICSAADEAPERSLQRPQRGGPLSRLSLERLCARLVAHDPLVDRAVPAYGLAHLLGGLLLRARLGGPARDDAGADPLCLPV